MIAARPCQFTELSALRAQYREEMNCQVIHESIHARPGWTREFALDLDGALVGYGSVAVAGPWTETPALYEFHVDRKHRMRTFDLFASLLEVCGAKIIETQSNAISLPIMLNTFARNVRSEAILFEDGFETSLSPEGASFRATTAADADALRDLDAGAGWVVLMNGEIAGSGGVLYHYNPPYGDIYMQIAEPFRRRGLGAYIVQELKSACRARSKIPAARCNVDNLPSRKTLQRAGFIPCGNIVVGDLPAE